MIPDRNRCAPTDSESSVPRVWRNFLILILCLHFCHTEALPSLKMSRFEVPNEVLIGNEIQLVCNYTLINQKLYSYKWYKGEKEFYRFMPSKASPIQTFPVGGITINIRKSNEYMVTLLNVTRLSAGVYKCEVSGEAPLFQTVIRQDVMKVYVIPEKSPIILMKHFNYQENDEVKANCTSTRSFPTATIEWYINGDKANSSLLEEYDVTKHPDDMFTKTVGLRFRLNNSHFSKGRLRLRCVARMSNLYWKSNEEILYSNNQFSNKETSSAHRYLTSSSFRIKLDINVSSLWIIFLLLSTQGKIFQFTLLFFLRRLLKNRN